MRRRGQRAAWLALVVLLLLAGTGGQATGQGPVPEPVRLFGHVQWIAAERMMITTDCPFLEACTSVSVNIDLRRVPQSEYRGVRSGSWVVVEGVVSHDNARHRVLATSVKLVEEWGAP